MDCRSAILVKLLMINYHSHLSTGLVHKVVSVLYSKIALAN